jgi:hypothetical protein
MAELPVLRGKLALDGLGLGRIDRGGKARVLIMDEDTVIILAADEVMDFELRQ